MERVKLWDKYTGPVDQEAIKLEFFRKISRKNPPFRVKVRLPRRNRALIPPMVKYHYEKPAKLLPSLRDVLRVESVYGRETIKSEIMSDGEDDVKINNCDDMDVFEMNGNGNMSENVVNGVCKLEGDVFNGIDAMKKEIFLPDIVADLTGEGKLVQQQWCWSVACSFFLW